MTKPLGVTVGMRVHMPSRTEDAVWDAVREAIGAGWSPERFRSEASDAWAQTLRDDAKHAETVLSQS